MKNKSEIEEAVYEAAEMILGEVNQFWQLESNLTLEEMVAKGTDPLACGPLEFKSACEVAAIGKFRAEGEAREAEEPPEPPTDEEFEAQVQAEYEARVAATTDPDELAAIVRENEQLLTADSRAERAEINRRAERSTALREQLRKGEPRPSKGISEEDWNTLAPGDRNVVTSEKTSPRPTISNPLAGITDPDELHRIWVEQGRPTRKADED